jgi:hypothetical protein
VVRAEWALEVRGNYRLVVVAAGDFTSVFFDPNTTGYLNGYHAGFRVKRGDVVRHSPLPNSTAARRMRAAVRRLSRWRRVSGISRRAESVFPSYDDVGQRFAFRRVLPDGVDRPANRFHVDSSAATLPAAAERFHEMHAGGHLTGESLRQ